MSRGARLIGLLLIVIGLLLIIRCSGDVVTGESPESETEVTMVSHTQCKTFDRASPAYDISSNLDCLEYDYDGSAVLHISRINAGFNCCPDSLTASIEIDGSSVIIHEAESLTNGCHCLCLYDMAYDIGPLSPRQITVYVREPYLQSGDQLIAVTIDLASEPSGSICIERTHYPWGLED